MENTSDDILVSIPATFSAKVAIQAIDRFLSKHFILQVRKYEFNDADERWHYTLRPCFIPDMATRQIDMLPANEQPESLRSIIETKLLSNSRLSKSELNALNELTKASIEIFEDSGWQKISNRRHAAQSARSGENDLGGNGKKPPDSTTYSGSKTPTERSPESGEDGDLFDSVQVYGTTNIINFDTGILTIGKGDRCFKVKLSLASNVELPYSDLAAEWRRDEDGNKDHIPFGPNETIEVLKTLAKYFKLQLGELTKSEM
jgi:hypothetical protein